MRFALKSLDHLVLTVGDVEASIAFYSQVLGMEARTFQGVDATMRHALYFGTQKINLHVAGGEYAPHAARPVPGSADLCFLTDTPLAHWQAHLAEINVPVLEGPVVRSGASGAIRSLYIRDPDGNLIEVSNPV